VTFAVALAVADRSTAIQRRYEPDSLIIDPNRNVSGHVAGPNLEPAPAGCAPSGSPSEPIKA
jgi:hypothetical protein